MKSPLISIIIPNYNKAEFINQTIQSVLNQTYKNWELIIVDDCSTDNSWNQVQSFQFDSRIKMYRNERKTNGSKCRNLGIEKSTGDLIIFLDSDDLMHQDCLNKRLLIFSKYNHCDFLVFPTGTFYKTIGDHKHVWIPKRTNYLASFLKHDLPWNIMSVLWKKSCLLRLKGFDVRYERLQDVELHTRALMLENVQFKCFDSINPDCYYRIDNSRTKLNKKNQILSQLQGVIRYVRNFKQINNKDYSKYLKGTILSFISNLNYHYKSKSISKAQYNEIKLEFFSGLNELTLSEIKFLSMYNFLYQVGLSRIKGFNYLIRIVYINIL